MTTKPPTENLNFRVDSALKEAFYAACIKNDQMGSQVLREFMRRYVQQHGQTKLL